MKVGIQAPDGTIFLTSNEQTVFRAKCLGWKIVCEATAIRRLKAKMKGPYARTRKKLGSRNIKRGGKKPT